jgi:hypothetical protein
LNKHQGQGQILLNNMGTFKTSLAIKIEGQEAWEGEARIPIFQTTEDDSDF